MTALATSATSAPEAVLTYDISGDYLYALGEALDVPIDGSGASLWFKIRLREFVPALLRLTITEADGPNGTYRWHSYYSDNPAETGSTIIDSGNLSINSALSPPSPSLNLNGLPNHYWWFFELRPTAPFASSFGIQAQAFYNIQPSVQTGSGAKRDASVVAGSTAIELIPPSYIRGSTKVKLTTAPATDEIGDSPDLSSAGSRSTGVGDWYGPMSHAEGEPTIVSEDLGLTWSLTNWHRAYVGGAGTVQFSDDVAGSPSVMAVYAGPENAGYADLTLLSGGHVNFTDSGIGGAIEPVDLTEGTWLYIQHAYVFTFDGSGYAGDGSEFPAQRLTFDSAYVPPANPYGTPGRIVGSTSVECRGASPFGLIAGFTTVRGTFVSVPDPTIGHFDPIEGSTAVEYDEPVPQAGTFDPIAGSTTVTIPYAPDLSDNPPITVALQISAYLGVVQPSEDAGLPTQMRHVAIKVVTVPAPVVVNGKPMLPKYRTAVGAAATLNVGPGHIRAIAPAPTWDGSGYVNPPPTTQHPWAGRWVVDDLPDPPDGGYYWLGAPSSKDGTARIAAGKRQWKAHGSTPHAPAWHSFFPFKPSVRATDIYLPGGGTVHHPKGVHLNSEFIEHMWLDFGGPRRQPFTWVIAAMVINYPHPHYRHFILDAGRSPDAVGFPRIDDSQTGRDRKIHDGLAYRNLIAHSPTNNLLTASPSLSSGAAVRARAVTNHQPRMFFGIFNGASSYVGDYAAGGKRIAKGRILNGAAQQHRYYVLGRSQGVMSQDKASHLLVFEIRYWSYALSKTELAEQYDQISSTYHFNRYRRG